jgi:hypothetical protein
MLERIQQAIYAYTEISTYARAHTVIVLPPSQFLG